MPLCLVAALRVTLNIFFVDVLIAHRLRSFFNDAGTLAMSGFLMIAYLNHHAPMLTVRTVPDSADEASSRAFVVPATRPARALLTGFGLLALGLGAVVLVWLAVLILQHFTH